MVQVMPRCTTMCTDVLQWGHLGGTLSPRQRSRETRLLAETLYFGLTTGTGLSTLGEEYCDILQVAGARISRSPQVTSYNPLQGTSDAHDTFAAGCTCTEWVAWHVLLVRESCAVSEVAGLPRRAGRGGARHPAPGTACVPGDAHAVPDRAPAAALRQRGTRFQRTLADAAG